MSTRWVQTFLNGRAAVYADDAEQLERAVRELGEDAWRARASSRALADAEHDEEFAAELAREDVRARAAELAELKPDGTVADLLERLPGLTVEQLEHLLLVEARGDGRRGVWDAVRLELKRRAS